jgi:hypothetical protein
LASYRTVAQLFWVIKNGINMTGVPSFFLAGAKDEELWSIAAFIKQLPSISEADYRGNLSSERKRTLGIRPHSGASRIIFRRARQGSASEIQRILA